MKYLDEYRDAASAGRYIDEIKSNTTRPWTIMEICGGQTHAIIKHGLDQLLAGQITLLHGPGCPVCVTPIELVDKAIYLAAKEKVILCSFGDMLRVPGTSSDLLSVRAEGGNVQVIYSPLDAVRIAQENPNSEVVLFAIGFETTAPGNAAAVHLARQLRLSNFSILSAQVLVPPAIEAILSSPDCRIDGFLAAGHVCTVTGTEAYDVLSSRYRIPFVATGFEPVDLLQGIYMLINCLENGRIGVEIQYSRVVRPGGNPPARKLMNDTFAVTDRKWRGVGMIPGSGLRLRDEFRAFDAEIKFGLSGMETEELSECISGQILQGIKKPPECRFFGKECTPERPMGATMVSSEGACAAYFRYR